MHTLGEFGTLCAADTNANLCHVTRMEQWPEGEALISLVNGQEKGETNRGGIRQGRRTAKGNPAILDIIVVAS